MQQILQRTVANVGKEIRSRVTGVTDKKQVVEDTYEKMKSADLQARWQEIVEIMVMLKSTVG